MIIANSRQIYKEPHLVFTFVGETDGPLVNDILVSLSPSLLPQFSPLYFESSGLIVSFSLHKHSVQYLLLSPSNKQQSPLSNSHPSILASSSQILSPKIRSDTLQVFGSSLTLHRHSLQYFLLSLSDRQQSPLSNSQASLFASSSQ